MRVPNVTSRRSRQNTPQSEESAQRQSRRRWSFTSISILLSAALLAGTALPSDAVHADATASGGTLTADDIAHFEGERSHDESPEAKAERLKRERTAQRTRSRAVGWPWRGRLEGATLLEPSEHVVHVERYLERGRFWGTGELVQLVNEAARKVSEVHGPSVLPVGELSAKYGRNISGHRSHENGRDADLGFYFIDDDGKPYVFSEYFAKTSRSGRAYIEGGRVRFDTARNWTLVRAMLESDVDVQHIFVANNLRIKLLRHARRDPEVSELLYEKASRVLHQPGGSTLPHRDHFHVRILCSEEDRPSCRERGPFWPWVSAPEGAHIMNLGRILSDGTRL